MNTIKLSSRRVGYAVIAMALLLAAMVPALTSAAQVTNRSIALSSSSVSAENVTYTVNFTPNGAAGAFVVDFCSNSPVLGQPCTAPAGFDVGTPASTTTNFTDVAEVNDDANNNTLRVTGAMTASVPVSVEITGITNPSASGPLYARIVTFADAAAANGYTSTEPDTVGVHIDDGGVAISITETIGVSGAVLESMLFCVSGETINANCVGGGSEAPALAAPSLELGENVGGVIALNSDDVYTGTIYTQISTNAANGAVVRLKSSATDCGGLINSSKPDECYILPALQTDILPGEAKFGVKLGPDSIDPNSGTIQAFPASGYSVSAFALNWAADNATGVTSAYGDPLLGTDSKPANNKNMTLTFGASVSNNTPAGSYSADLGLIATGKF